MRPWSIPVDSAGWSAQPLDTGDILCARTASQSKAPSAHMALALDIHRQRLASIAEEMGASLMKLLSANVKERKDYHARFSMRRVKCFVMRRISPFIWGAQP